MKKALALIIVLTLGFALFWFYKSTQVADYHMQIADESIALSKSFFDKVQNKEFKEAFAHTAPVGVYDPFTKDNFKDYLRGTLGRYGKIQKHGMVGWQVMEYTPDKLVISRMFNPPAPTLNSVIQKFNLNGTYIAVFMKVQYRNTTVNQKVIMFDNKYNNPNYGIDKLSIIAIQMADGTWSPVQTS